MYKKNLSKNLLVIGKIADGVSEGVIYNQADTPILAYRFEKKESVLEVRFVRDLRNFSISISTISNFLGIPKSAFKADKSESTNWLGVRVIIEAVDSLD